MKTNTIIFDMNNKIIKRKIRKSDSGEEYVLHLGMKAVLEVDDVIKTENYVVTKKKIAYYV